MSFLGSIGLLMSGSGLRSALETVYVPVTVGRMFTRKAYSRAIRSHLLCASAIMSLILEEFLNGLSHDEQKTLEELYNSDRPSDQSISVIAKELIDFIERKEKLTRESRISAVAKLCSICFNREGVHPRIEQMTGSYTFLQQKTC